jgi:signal peptide peptidase SppA
MKRQRFAPHGLLALAPRAFGFVFDLPDEPKSSTENGVAVVHVHGPLMHHREWCFDSYDAIKDRVASALAAKPKALVLAIDSPGGLVSGCFATSRELRAMAAAAGVPLHAYVDGQATSAAYALACAASEIHASSESLVGSIGVLDALMDASQQDAMFGVKITMIASGARKLDGNPHEPTTEAAIAERQGTVNALAEQFFDLVSESRGVSPDDVRALDAGILLATDALGRGLVDSITTLDSLLSALASGATTTTNKEKTMSYKEAVAALRKAAESDDKDEAEKAKRMLAAVEENEEDSDEEASEDDDADKDEKAEDEEEEKEAATSGSGSSASTPVELAAVVQAQGQELRELRAEREAAKKDALFASRPDLAKELVKVLRKKSYAEAKAIVDAMPAPKKPKPAASASVIGTQGATQGLAAAPNPEMDRVMGISRESAGVKREAFAVKFGALTREEAAAAIAAKGAAR